MQRWQFTTVPLKLCLSSINQILYFHLWFHCRRLALFCLEKMKKLTVIINTFLVRKHTISSTVLIRLMFLGYRCKSDIAIFAWRVTEMYAYTVPLNFFSVLGWCSAFRNMYYTSLTKKSSLLTIFTLHMYIFY